VFAPVGSGNADAHGKGVAGLRTTDDALRVGREVDSLGANSRSAFAPIRRYRHAHSKACRQSSLLSSSKPSSTRRLNFLTS
jgi:hypothetical protein